MGKSVNEMNEKMWYRAVKVLFFLSVIFTLISYNAIVFSEVGFKNLDHNKTILSCNVPFDSKKTISLEEARVSVDDSYFKDATFNYRDFFEGYNDFEIREILEVCTGKDVSLIDISSLQKEFEVRKKYKEMSNLELFDSINENSEPTADELSGSPEWKYRMFDVTPSFSYNQFLLYLFGGNVITILVFEIIRRIFYYVVLGRLRPI